MTVNEAWKKIIEKYDIIKEVSEKGGFFIKANEIKEFKEPRLMAKWDSSDCLPDALKKHKLNILPVSRSEYVIGDFLLYEPIPELEEPVTQMDQVILPEYESIDVNNITSESNAINVLILSGILDDFLGTEDSVSTFNGRMGTGEFDYYVNTENGSPYRVKVRNAQCEIDGGFENTESVVIMEAKNVLHEDFHIRQLYYPYRLWKNKVNKPIRLVFSIYSNMIYRLFEYEFMEIDNYSSIKLLKSKNYSLQDTNISIEDLMEVRQNTAIETDDNMDTQKNAVPFIQANSMERVISLLEHLYDNAMTQDEVAELMDFEPRQSDYYFNAGKYLGLFDRKKEDKITVYCLTKQGLSLCKMNYKDRQLKLAECLFKHRIFAEAFDFVINNGELPGKEWIANLMREYNVCNEGQIIRRASSVYGWIKWLINLTKL